MHPYHVFCKRCLCVLLLLFVYEFPPSRSVSSAQDKAPAAAEKQTVARITVAADITHFVEPRTPDGLVDVVAAVNRHFSEGVTPERNAAVVLYQVLGHSPANTRLSDRFFEELGIDVPAEDGDYFANYFNWRKSDSLPQDVIEASMAEFNRGMESPWKRAELVSVFAWLERYAGHLDRIAKGMQRPNFYSPLVPPQEANGRPKGIIFTLLPGIQMSRELARALISRGMLHLGEGRKNDAWQDFIAVHRFGRLLARGTTLIERLVGMALESMALDAERKWLEIAQPGEKQLVWIRSQLESLPPIVQMADAIDVSERGTFVESVFLLAGNRLTVPELGDIPVGVPAVLQKAGVVTIDWNTVLRRGNQSYDRMVAAMRLDDRKERQTAMLKLRQELQTAQTKASAPGSLALALLPGLSSAVVTELMSATLAAMLLPSIEAVQHAQDRLQQNFDNLQITLSLFAARAKSGEFAEQLGDLVPTYEEAIPIDLFSGGPLKYRRTADGFELYSVGRNETDDGGRTFDDKEPGDDLVVRISIPDSNAKN